MTSNYLGDIVVQRFLGEKYFIILCDLNISVFSVSNNGDNYGNFYGISKGRINVRYAVILFEESYNGIIKISRRSRSTNGCSGSQS